jgi:hypothetical protein
LAIACAAACGEKTTDAEKAPLPVKVEEPAKAPPEAVPVVPIDDKAEAGAPDAKAEDAKAVDDAKAADDGKADTTGDAKAEGGDAADGGAAAPADPKVLFTEVKNKKTKDDRALAALAEAETAGAKLRDVAAAANARGEKLFETPDRAKTFFEWAAAKDPKYPEPVFNLAKQAVITGDLEVVTKHLTEVKARGGKKLLGQIEYDATWEPVKDDPTVRKLLGG